MSPTCKVSVLELRWAKIEGAPDSWLLCWPAWCYLWQTRPDQGFHSIPNHRIAFNLGVRLHEDTIVPGVLGAVERALFIVKSEVSNDPRACSIGGVDIMVAVDEPMGLIEIDCLSYIRGDTYVIVARL